jgi:hypothetical protein
MFTNETMEARPVSSADESHTRLPLRTPQYIEPKRKKRKEKEKETELELRPLFMPFSCRSKALELRVVLTHVLLSEARDWKRAEEALRAVLTIDPAHAEAQHNLALLLNRRRGKGPREK